VLSGLLQLRSAVILLALLLALQTAWVWQQRSAPLTQEDIDAAVRHSLEQEPLPSMARRAADRVLPSVVRVEGEMARPAPPRAAPRIRPQPGGEELDGSSLGGGHRGGRRRQRPDPHQSACDRGARGRSA
jgi:hypothetical protein